MANKPPASCCVDDKGQQDSRTGPGKMSNARNPKRQKHRAIAQSAAASAVDVDKPGLAAILIFLGAIVADRHWNFGFYTDGAIGLLVEVRRSFGY